MSKIQVLICIESNCQIGRRFAFNNQEILMHSKQKHQIISMGEFLDLILQKNITEINQQAVQSKNEIYQLISRIQSNFQKLLKQIENKVEDAFSRYRKCSETIQKINQEEYDQIDSKQIETLINYLTQNQNTLKFQKPISLIKETIQVIIQSLDKLITGEFKQKQTTKQISSLIYTTPTPNSGINDVNLKTMSNLQTQQLIRSQATNINTVSFIKNYKKIGRLDISEAAIINELKKIQGSIDHINLNVKQLILLNSLQETQKIQFQLNICPNSSAHQTLQGYSSQIQSRIIILQFKILEEQTSVIQMILVNVLRNYLSQPSQIQILSILIFHQILQDHHQFKVQRYSQSVSYPQQIQKNLGQYQGKFFKNLIKRFYCDIPKIEYQQLAIIVFFKKEMEFFIQVDGKKTTKTEFLKLYDLQ